MSSRASRAEKAKEAKDDNAARAEAESANQQAAQECLSVAEQALEGGDLEKALKWAVKSFGMCRTSEAEALTARVRALQAEAAAAAPTPSTSSDSANGGAANGEAANGGASSSSGPSAAEIHGWNDKELVSRVLRATNHYEVLGVANRANVQEIKRAYRKLTVALHPDKNQTPGAEDAFKNVGEAHRTLSNTQERLRYDLQLRQQTYSGRGRGGGVRWQAPMQQQRPAPSSAYAAAAAAAAAA